MNSERYSRQGMVPEFSGEGQQTLEDASILIIGASSIGSTLMYNLASAGIGTIGVADHNIVGTSNLNAPIHFEEDLGTQSLLMKWFQDFGQYLKLIICCRYICGLW